MDIHITQGATEWKLTPTGDQTSTSATAGSITGLSLELKANTKYEVHGFIHHGCNNTGGVKFSASIPSGATIFIGLKGVSASNTLLENALAESDTLSTNGFGQFNNQNRTTNFFGTITTGATAGTMQLKYASGVNGQTSTIYEEGSVIQITRLGEA